MDDEQIVVSLHLFESGQLKAFADVTLHTSLGEITIRGFRVVRNAGFQPWVAFPRTSYQKNGETKAKDLLDMLQAMHRKLADAILAAFKRLTQND